MSTQQAVLIPPPSMALQQKELFHFDFGPLKASPNTRVRETTTHLLCAGGRRFADLLLHGQGIGSLAQKGRRE